MSTGGSSSEQLRPAAPWWYVLPADAILLDALHTMRINPKLCITYQQTCCGSTGAAVDSWDRLRDGAVSCLMKLPSPLPGMATPEALLPQLRWACSLLRSPRVRESDAGRAASPASITHLQAAGLISVAHCNAVIQHQLLSVMLLVRHF